MRRVAEQIKVMTMVTVSYDCGHEIKFPSMVPKREQNTKACAFCRNKDDFEKHIEDMWSFFQPNAVPEKVHKYIYRRKN